MSINFPENAILVSQIFNKVANFNVLPVENLNRSILEFNSETEGATRNKFFQKYSYPTSAFILNLGILFYIFALIAFSFLIIYPLHLTKLKVFVYLKQKLYYGTVIRFILESYFEFLLVALTNII